MPGFPSGILLWLPTSEKCNLGKVDIFSLETQNQLFLNRSGDVNESLCPEGSRQSLHHTDHKNCIWQTHQDSPPTSGGWERTMAYFYKWEFTPSHPWQSQCMMYVLKYDSEFHFMTTFETAFKLPLFCHFTFVSSLWQEILFIPALHFKTFTNCL